MTNYQSARAEFEKYLDSYDRNNDKIQLKIIHTYGVVKCSERIALRMGLSGEDVELARIIALLHDIGRFEQLRRFDSFEADTMDHAAYGIQLLFEEGQIERFLSDESVYDIIRTGIARHSDFILGDDLGERVLLHARLIRDADKLDNCRVKLTDSIETLLGASPDQVGSCSITPSVSDAFFDRKCILSADRKTLMDYWVSYVAYFYDMNFQETLELVCENQYVSKMIRRIPYTNPQTAPMMERMEQFMTEDIEKRIHCK